MENGCMNINEACLFLYNGVYHIHRGLGGGDCLVTE